jgi:hypothetical protein
MKLSKILPKIHRLFSFALLSFGNLDVLSLFLDCPLLLVPLKPMGGSEEEITGIYLPLGFPDDRFQPNRFPYTSPDHLGDFSSARLRDNDNRLAFRNIARPFRYLGTL